MTPKPIWGRLNLEQLFTQFVAWLPSLFAAGLIFVFFWLLFRATRAPLRRLLARAGFESALAAMLENVYRFLLIALGIIMGAGQLGINVGAALAGLGVVGLTVGFAAKDSLSNIMAGFLIFWDKPFRVNDWITIAGNYGKVAAITMRTTRLQTRDNRWVVIPNATVIDQVLINHSSNGSVRLEVPVGIGYTDEIAQARAAILRALKEVEPVLQSPAPAVVVNDLGPSSVDLLVFAWIANAQDEKPAFFAIVEAVKLALDAAGISIPAPQLDLSVKAVAPPLVQAAKEFAHANGR